MIRPDKIISAFFGGVGFRDSTVSGIPALDTANEETRSGMVFQDGNFLVTLQNIYDCQQDPDIEDTEFNTLLTNMQNAVILETVNKVAEQQSDFCQASNLYPYEKAFRDTIEPSDRAVGFKVTPNLINRRILEIPWVELSFDSAKTFNVYLYNSNIPTAPIAPKEVTTQAGRSVIAGLNWYISDDVTYKGGDFYLVYFEDDLDGAKAFKKDYDLASYQIETAYYYIQPVTVEHTGAVINVVSANEQSETFGLNIGVNVYDDYTEVFIRNQGLFWNAIKHQMAEKVLNLIATSPRTNDTERSQQARLQLYGSKEHGIVGVTSKLSRAVEDLRKMLFYQPRISRGTLRS